MIGIYPILDIGPLCAPADAPDKARALVAGGATILQLRAKGLPARDFLALAQEVRAITQGATVFVVNDRPDIATLCGADGVHLGQDDLPAKAVRPWLPPEIFIGVSCHSLEQAIATEKEAIARYIGFGPVHATTSKANPEPVVGLDGAALVRRRLPHLPVVAIGGLSLADLPFLARHQLGAAMISALLSASDLKAATQRAVDTYREAACAPKF